MNRSDERDDLEYNEIEMKIEMNIKRIEDLSKWQAVAFSATCAERVAPICLHLGRERTWVIFEAGLKVVWAASMGKEKKHEAVKLRHAFEMTPDAHIETALLPEYYAMRSLSILEAALDAVISDDGKESAKSACYQMFGLMVEFDATFEQFFILPATSEMDKEQRENTFAKNLRKKPGFWQKLGFYVRTYFNHYFKKTAESLEARELVVQQDVLNVLMAQTEPSVEVITQLRHQARHLSKTIEQVAPLIVKDTNLSRQRRGEVPETYETITTVIEGLTKWQAVAFSATCVERMSPICHQEATAQHRVLFESGLNLLWSASLKEVSPQKVADIQHIIDATPESELEELNPPAWYAWDTLCILADALEAATSTTGRKSARFVCSGMFGLMAAFDFFWRKLPNTHKEQHVPFTSFMSLESAAQQEMLKVLTSQTELSAEFIDQIRKQAQQFSKQLEKQLPHLFEVIQQKFEMMEQEEDDSE